MEELDPKKMYRLSLENGYLDIRVSSDPDYPGLDVEYIDYREEHQIPHTRPRVLIECPKDIKELRTLVWADPGCEDYSENIVFRTEFPTPGQDRPYRWEL